MGHHPPKMLIIGSSGLVGSNLLYFSSHYAAVTVPTFHRFLPETYRQSGLLLDITNPAALRGVIASVAPDCVVNLSCMAVARCEHDPDRAYQVQTEGVKHLAGICSEYRIRLIHLSTDMVYSGNKGSPYIPSDPPDPISVYGQTKLEGERAIEEMGGDYLMVRCGLVLGSGRFRRGGFLDWMRDRVAGEQELPLYADQLRTPLVVDDLVDLIFTLATSPVRGVLLAGGDEAVNRVELGEKFLEAVGASRALIKPVAMDERVPYLPFHRDLRLDNTQVKEILGRERFTTLGDYFAGYRK